MKSKILDNIPDKAKDRHKICTVSHPEIHIVDWKDTDRKSGRAEIRGVEIFDRRPMGIKSVCLFNTPNLEITIDAFDENALYIKKGHQAEQCECVVAPALFSSDNWVLAVETKYAEDYAAAFKKDEDSGVPEYPEKMVSQIISTVDYLRDKGVIAKDKMVHAIVSFPKLISDFNSELFSWVKEEWSTENLILNYKIKIKGCNSANITSSKRIKHTD